MFTLSLCKHTSGPCILEHNTNETNAVLLAAKIRGIYFKRVFAADSREKCIQAWKIIKDACEKQLKTFQYN